MATVAAVTPDIKVTKLIIKPYHHHLHNAEHKERYCENVKVTTTVSKPKNCTMHIMYLVDVNGVIGHYCPACTSALEQNYEANKPKK